MTTTQNIPNIQRLAVTSRTNPNDWQVTEGIPDYDQEGNLNGYATLLVIESIISEPDGWNPSYIAGQTLHAFMLPVALFDDIDIKTDGTTLTMQTWTPAAASELCQHGSEPEKYFSLILPNITIVKLDTRNNQTCGVFTIHKTQTSPVFPWATGDPNPLDLATGTRLAMYTTETIPEVTRLWMP